MRHARLTAAISVVLGNRCNEDEEALTGNDSQLLDRKQEEKRPRAYGQER